MSDLPDSLRREVVAEVYRQAGVLDWDGLTDKRRSAVYDQWLDDPAIGGKLTRFLPRERARVWLKDVPMKEYARARNGIGPYSDLVTSRLPSPGQIARKVLGSGWDVIDGTISEKPNRCVISDGNEERLMMWGPPKTLRDIMWAGINALVDGKPTPILVVAMSHAQSLDEGEKRRNILLGRIAGLDVRHTVLRASKVGATEVKLSGEWAMGDYGDPEEMEMGANYSEDLAASGLDGGFAASAELRVGCVYTRSDLQNLFAITDSTINNGVFRLKNRREIWLFVTERKAIDRVPYEDELVDDVLEWQGQTSGRTDALVINHEKNGEQLLVFYRKTKYEFPGAGFRLEGAFKYVSHSGSSPTSFVLRRIR